MAKRPVSVRDAFQAAQSASAMACSLWCRRSSTKPSRSESQARSTGLGPGGHGGNGSSVVFSGPRSATRPCQPAWSSMGTARPPARRQGRGEPCQEQAHPHRPRFGQRQGKRVVVAGPNSSEDAGQQKAPVPAPPRANQRRPVRPFWPSRALSSHHSRSVLPGRAAGIASSAASRSLARLRLGAGLGGHGPRRLPRQARAVQPPERRPRPMRHGVSAARRGPRRRPADGCPSRPLQGPGRPAPRPAAPPAAPGPASPTDPAGGGCAARPNPRH